MLLAIKVSVDGYECTAFVDSGCLLILVNKHVCCFWRRICGYGRIKLDIGIAEPVHIDALIVDGQLLGIDTIRELGRMHITKLGEVAGR